MPEAAEAAEAAEHRADSAEGYEQHNLAAGEKHSPHSLRSPEGEEASANTNTAPALAYTRITTDADLTAIILALGGEDVLGLDVETTGPVVESAGVDIKKAALNPRIDRLCLVSIATRERVYLIDAQTVALEPLAPLLAGETGPTLIAHNAAFDLGFLQAAGLPIPEGSRVFDSLIAVELIERREKGAGQAITAWVRLPIAGSVRC